MANPYGECTSTSTSTVEAYGPACSYVYGYAKAYDDANIRGVSDPASYTWWLGVETGNGWSPDDTSANKADLEGIVAYFAASTPRRASTPPGRRGPRLSGQCLLQATCTSWLAGRSEFTRACETQMRRRPADRRQKSHPHSVGLGRLRLRAFLHLRKASSSIGSSSYPTANDPCSRPRFGGSCCRRATVLVPTGRIGRPLSSRSRARVNTALRAAGGNKRCQGPAVPVGRKASSAGSPWPHQSKSVRLEWAFPVRASAGTPGSQPGSQTM